MRRKDERQDHLLVRLLEYHAPDKRPGTRHWINWGSFGTESAALAKLRKETRFLHDPERFRVRNREECK